MKCFTIQFRLAAWYLISSAMILLIFATGSWFAMRASMYHSIDRDLQYRLKPRVTLRGFSDTFSTSAASFVVSKSRISIFLSPLGQNRLAFVTARGCYELCTQLDSLRGVVCC
jgi:hypothetical protein